jgi:hypothetical protein
LLKKHYMSKPIDCEPLKQLIRAVPDFPKPGILFYDITTLLKEKAGLAQLIDAFAQYYIDKKVDLVLGIEARIYLWAGTGVQAECRVRSGAQTEEAARRGGEGAV